MAVTTDGSPSTGVSGDGQPTRRPVKRFTDRGAIDRGSGGLPASGGGSGASGGDLDAKATIVGFLDQYGLGSLGEWAWQAFLDGVPISQIMLDLRSRPEYKARFPAMEALAKKGRAMTEAEYVAYERSAAGLFRVAGLPDGFYDSPEDFANLIANEVSVNELSSRVQTAFVAVAQAPQVVKDKFAEFYGPNSDKALAAYMLDPDKALPMIESQIASANFAGIGSRFDFNIGQPRAEQMSREGIDGSQVAGGFAQADRMRALSRDTVLEAQVGSTVSEDQLLDATFGVGSEAPIRRRLEQRVAAFSGSGGTVQSTGGAIGLGGSQKG